MRISDWSSDVCSSDLDDDALCVRTELEALRKLLAHRRKGQAEVVEALALRLRLVAARLAERRLIDLLEFAELDRQLLLFTVPPDDDVGVLADRRLRDHAWQPPGFRHFLPVAPEADFACLEADPKRVGEGKSG